MSRSSEGLRALHRHLTELKHLDDATFAEVTGSDRAEAMALLEKLNELLGNLDAMKAQLRAD